MQINVKELFSPIKLTTTEDFMIPVLETGRRVITRIHCFW